MAKKIYHFDPANLLIDPFYDLIILFKKLQEKTRKSSKRRPEQEVDNLPVAVSNSTCKTISAFGANELILPEMCILKYAFQP